MKYFLFFFLIGFFYFNCPAQVDSNTTLPVFVTPKMPQFPGGDMAILKYISSMDYSTIPFPNIEDNFTPKAFIGFTIDKEGNVTNVNILKSSGIEAFDKAALVHVQKMPKWIPVDTPVEMAIPFQIHLE
ncbi:MAG: energy transducer TonB [Chitinophagales bacterium]